MNANYRYTPPSNHYAPSRSVSITVPQRDRQSQRLILTTVSAILVLIANIAVAQQSGSSDLDAPLPPGTSSKLLGKIFGASLDDNLAEEPVESVPVSPVSNAADILNALNGNTPTAPVENKPAASSPTINAPTDLATALVRKGNITFSQTPLEKALFMIGDAWKVNLVVGDDVTGTATAMFTKAPLHEILDSILLANGYGYRAEGESLVITSLEGLGDDHPLFERALVTLKSAEPEEVVNSAQMLNSPRGRIEPIASGRSILVIDFPKNIKKIRDFAEQMDEVVETQQQEAGTEQLRPEDAEVAYFNPLYIKVGSLKESIPNLLTPGGKFTLNEAENRIMVVDQPEVVEKVRNLVADLDTANNQIQVVDFRLQFVQSAIILESVQSVLSPDGTATTIDEENRIVVVDYPPVMDIVKRLVTSLDVPRPQVRITALIYDMSLSDIERLGVNWNHTINSGNGVTTGLDSRQLLAAAATEPATTLTFQYMSNNFDISTVIDLLCTASDSRLLADPTITCIDRRPAEISIVREIPYQELTESAEGGAVGTTAFREAGISMAVTPRIANDGTIEMEIAPEFSALTGFTPGESALPIIDSRRASTTVRIRDKQVLVLGGLRQREDTYDYTGVPGLKDIKWFNLGAFFRSKNITVRESELVVFLRPEILPPDYAGRIREVEAHNVIKQQLDNVPVWHGPPYPCDTGACGLHGACGGRCGGRCSACRGGGNACSCGGAGCTSCTGGTVSGPNSTYLLPSQSGDVIESPATAPYGNQPTPAAPAAPEVHLQNTSVENDAQASTRRTANPDADTLAETPYLRRLPSPATEHGGKRLSDPRTAYRNRTSTSYGQYLSNRGQYGGIPSTMKLREQVNRDRARYDNLKRN